MRRPALYRPTRTATGPGWSHPYTGPLAHAVFYNDGGNEGSGSGQGAGVPTPADLAARATQQTVGQGQQAAAGPQPLIDRQTGQPMTQDRLTQLCAKQKDEGRRSVLRSLAESVGLNPDEVDADKLTGMLKNYQQAARERMSEVERREADATEAQKRAAQAARAEAEQIRRDAEQRILLTRMGVTPDNLRDVGALLSNDLTAAGLTEPTAEQVKATAEKLKERRPQDFGQPAAAQGMPPAPGGAPAGGQQPRQPTATKDAVRSAARQRAIDMGLRAADDAA